MPSNEHVFLILIFTVVLGVVALIWWDAWKDAKAMKSRRVIAPKPQEFPKLELPRKAPALHYSFCVAHTGQLVRLGRPVQVVGTKDCEICKLN